MPRELSTLLRHLAPVLDPVEYVFIQLPTGMIPVDLNPLMWFCEAEGPTAIVPADALLPEGVISLYRCRRITLSIASDLQAVGLLAAVSRAIAEIGVSLNVVSAINHDHLFVPIHSASIVLDRLNELSHYPQR